MKYDEPMPCRIACILSVCLIALALAGCAENDTPDAVVIPEPPPSPWQSDGQGWLIALPEHEDDARLATAIAQARLTAADARERWLESPESERTNWAVKWAAPLQYDRGNDNDEKAETDSDAVEHVWVMPMHWSPFRIEGVLISDPVNTLHNERARGDLVSFPIEELSDWVHFVKGDPDGARVGGFTIDALEATYGKPPPM